MKRQRAGGFLIGKIHRLAHRIFTKKLKEYRINLINPAQGRIMFVLWRNDGISIKELGEKTSLKKSTMTSMLDRLEENGYIKRVPSKEDRRKILIKRTQKDIEMEKKYIEVSQDMTGIYYSGFSDEDKDRFEDYLRRLLKNLVSYEQKIT